MAITEEMIYGNAQMQPNGDMPASYGPTIRDLLTLSRGIKPEMDTEELTRIANLVGNAR